MLFLDEAHIPGLSYSFFSLRVASTNRNKYIGTKDGIMVKLSILFPSIGRLNFLNVYRSNALYGKMAKVTIVPGLMPAHRSDHADIN